MLDEDSPKRLTKKKKKDKYKTKIKDKSKEDKYRRPTPHREPGE